MSDMITGRVVIRPPAGFVNVLHTRKHSGMAYRYVVNAVSKLDRPLKRGEVVHHIDGNIRNDDVNNLMVFTSSSDHLKYHRSGYNSAILVDNGDGTYRTVNGFSSSYAEYTCYTCGKQFPSKKCNHHHSTRVFCSDACLCKYRQRNIPDKDTLIELLKSSSLSGVGRIYSVSGNAVKKWCKRYNIDYKNLR